MDRLRELVLSIGLEELMNCILVEAGVRNAMLIQPTDYNEHTSADPITKAKITAIRAAFPDLVLSNIHGETLISRKHYAEADFIKDENMGEILGYPCAKGFNTLDRENVIYGFDISVNLVPGFNADKLQLLAYICPDKKTLKKSLAFAKRCETVLKSNALVGHITKSVKVSINKITPVSYLINKLVKNKQITKDEDSDIKNYIANLGFPNSTLVNQDFQYKNPVHRGLVLGLLAFYNNYPISAFYPLTGRKEYRQVQKLDSDLEKELDRVFTLTARSPRKRATRKLKSNDSTA
jgi:hypothetical protein